VAALVLLDLSSAFDITDPNILLTLLANRFSICETTLDWFRSSLTDRSQYFFHNSQQTAPEPVVRSVPQGPVLGPLEFTPTRKMSLTSLLKHLLS
jgi:Reverse transcriptase (RNA-dependent DNA polymerase)